MSNQRDKRLASILRAIEQLHTEKALFMTDWKNRIEILESQAAALTEDILSGQSELGLAVEGEKTA